MFVRVPPRNPVTLSFLTTMPAAYHDALVGSALGPLPAHLALSSAGVNSSQERTMTRAGSDHGGGTRARGRGKGRGKAASTLVVLVEREAACRSARGNSCYVG